MLILGAGSLHHLEELKVKDFRNHKGFCLELKYLWLFCPGANGEVKTVVLHRDSLAESSAPARMLHGWRSPFPW